MKLINQGFNDRVRFIIDNTEFGSKIITEPEGWDTDQKEISRHKDYHGIFPKFSNSLKFVEDGKDYIKMVYAVVGINAHLRLKKQIRHPKTDEWITEYYGYLDISTYVYEDNKVSIKFNSGGLESILKARENEQLEVTRETSIDGVPLAPLKIDEVELEGRRIFLKSDLEVKDKNNSVRTDNQSSAGNVRGSTYPAPIKIINKSHEELQSPIQGTRVGDDSWGKIGNGENGLMFFAVSENARTLRIKFEIKFHTYFLPSQPPFYTSDSSGFDDVDTFMFGLRLARYGGGSDYNNIWNDYLVNTGQHSEVENVTRVLTYDKNITINAGDSLGLVFDQNLNGHSGHSSHLFIIIEGIECKLSIEEDSFFEKTISKTLLPHELAERLVEIISNKKCVYSDALGRTDIGYQADGKASLCGVSHGFWIRGFDAIPISTQDNLNTFKPLTISLKDFMESYAATWNLGLGIETFGNQERVRIESLDFFYNRNVGIILPNQISKVKRSIDIDSVYSSLDIGYEKGGSYEEAFGLDEYNGISKFTTIITRVKNIFIKKSKIRADTYGKEFARRKPKIRYGTQDTRYDTDNFFNDMKRGLGAMFLERKWQDDFAQAPAGTFSPDTATNLRLTPFNLLLRHGRFISSCLQKNTTDFVSYISSNGNSKLKTKLIGGNEYAENGQIINSELARPRFTSDIIEFTHQIDFNILQALDGYTEINGKKIPNIYCRIQFTNEDNETEYGYLLNCKINDGNFKLLKAY